MNPPISPETQSPGWEWYFVGLYFFIGGLAAGAFFIGTLVDLFARDKYPQISRVAYYLAFPLILLTPPLLIGDLGQPGRFWRLFWYPEGGGLYINLQSPLSVGSWALLVFALMSGLAFVNNLIQDGIVRRWYRVPLVRPLTGLFEATYGRLPRVLIALLGSAAGFFIAGYTGVLLNTTARPFWQATDPLIGALFIASAASTGAAAIALVMGLRRMLSGEAFVRLESFDRIVMLLELVLIVAVIVLAGTLAGPLQSGASALLFWVGAVGLGILVPLGLNWYALRRSGNGSHPAGSLIMLTALLALLGGALLRISLVQAGQL